MRKTDTEQEREKRVADLGRLDELFLRLVGLGDGPRSNSLADLEQRLQLIEDTIRNAYKAGLSVSEMLDLVETQDATHELAFRIPELVLRDETGAACEKIWDSILDTRNAMVLN